MINKGFKFSQSSLTTFKQCRRRFLLRYLQHVQWPAPLTDHLSEWEQAIQRGLSFHQLILQESLGLHVEAAIDKSDDPLLQTWWDNWRRQAPDMPRGELFSETILSVPCGERRLVAKFDRVIFAEDGRVLIFDWKTGRRKPQQAEYVENWQTLVYRFVVVEAGALLTGGHPVDPANVSLIYWHAQYPQALQPIIYSAVEHEAARNRLMQKVAEIEGLPDEAAYAKTEDLMECRRCEYHTYCERVSPRGEDWDIDEDELDWDLLPEAEL